MSAAEQADLLVIGAGPAGLAAAQVVATAGFDVLVVDREQEPGGVPRHCFHTGFGLRDLHRIYTGPSYARRRVELAQAAGARILPGCTITDWDGPTAVTSTSPSGRTGIEAKAVLLATGCRERPRSARMIPGDRPAGIYTTGAVQQLVHLEGHPVGQRAVVIGAEHIAFSAVHTLATSGTQVAAVLTEAPGIETFKALRAATAGLRRVPILYQHRIEAIHGKGRVDGLTTYNIETQQRRRIDCDTIVFTGDWVPDYELARAARLDMDPVTRGPNVDTTGATSSPGIFAAGNLQHPAEPADIAALGGSHVGKAILAWLHDPHLAAQDARSNVEIHVAQPLAWITPQRLRPGQAPSRQQFTLRAAERSGPGSLVVTQGDHVVYTQRLRRLVPNRTVTLAAPWIQSITHHHPITVSYHAANQ